MNVQSNLQTSANNKIKLAQQQQQQHEHEHEHESHPKSGPRFESVQVLRCFSHKCFQKFRKAEFNFFEQNVPTELLVNKNAHPGRFSWNAIGSPLEHVPAFVHPNSNTSAPTRHGL